MQRCAPGDKLFSEYLHRWNLAPDGELRHTHSSDLLPVRQNGVSAMLKIAREDEEKRGGSLMAWWNGAGAARVLTRDNTTGALLLERATGTRSLAEMAKSGQDEHATRVLCACLDQLHAPRATPPLPVLTPLHEWFRDLAPAAQKYGGIVARSGETARRLLATPQEETVLHGDVHHGNFLDFGPERGFLAIDPKGLWGERGFDYANIFCNPDRETVLAPGRLACQATVIACAARLDRTRLLQWVLAYAGLSAAWTLGDGDIPGHTLEIAHLAAGELAIGM